MRALLPTSKEHSISRRNSSSKTCGIRRCERRSTTRRMASGRLASPEDGVSISPSKATATFFATSFHIRSRVEHHTGTKKAGSNARLFSRSNRNEPSSAPPRCHCSQISKPDRSSHISQCSNHPTWSRSSSSKTNVLPPLWRMRSTLTTRGAPVAPSGPWRVASRTRRTKNHGWSK